LVVTSGLSAGLFVAEHHAEWVKVELAAVPAFFSRPDAEEKSCEATAGGSSEQQRDADLDHAAKMEIATARPGGVHDARQDASHDAVPPAHRGCG
jgi:hypothetical protein